MKIKAFYELEVGKLSYFNNNKIILPRYILTSNPKSFLGTLRVDSKEDELWQSRLEIFNKMTSQKKEASTSDSLAICEGIYKTSVEEHPINYLEYEKITGFDSIGYSCFINKALQFFN